MLKQAYWVSLISAAALGFISLPAHANEQNSVQVSKQTSAVVGDLNNVIQHSTQLSTQQQQGRYSEYGKANLDFSDQNIAQDLEQTSGVVGMGNYVRQKTDQITVQQQTKAYMNRYRHHH